MEEAESLLPSWEKVSAEQTDEGPRNPSPIERRAIHKTRQARRERREPTPAERRVWTLLRGRQLGDLKFRRQVPIGPYIADFVCFRGKIIVELDGGIHRAKVFDQERQTRRDAWLRGQGFTVLRFDSDAAFERPEKVLSAVLKFVRP